MQEETGMQFRNLAPMFDELQDLLSAKGCRVTELTVTFYPQRDEGQGPSIAAEVATCLPRPTEETLWRRPRKARLWS